MNKLKRFLGVALIAIMIMVPVFGAPLPSNAVLTVTTKVTGVFQFGLYEAKQTNASFVGGATLSRVIADIDPSGTGTKSSTPMYLSVRTNQRDAYKIGISATALTDTTQTLHSYMGYNIEFSAAENGGDIGTRHHIVSATSTPTTVPSLVVVAQGNGLRVLNYPFQIDILDTQYIGANEGIYTASITFNISTN